MIERTRVIIIKAVNIQTQHRDESKLILNEHQGENPKSSDQQYVDLVLTCGGDKGDVLLMDNLCEFFELKNPTSKNGGINWELLKGET